MPVARIETIREWPLKERSALLEAVHSAMVEALGIPQHDRVIRLLEHAPEAFFAPPSASQYFTLVEISMFPGRTLETKRKLYQSIIRNLGELGIPPTDVRIILYEPPMENWGIRGGIPASEVDLGFQVEV